jgi:hypothetical protein
MKIGKSYPTPQRVLNEREEAVMRDKVMLIVARKGWTQKVWTRVITRLKRCINIPKEPHHAKNNNRLHSQTD